jgi:hypothetical protein
VYESWSFGDGLYQPAVLSNDSVRVTRVSQWSVPIAVAIPLSSTWLLDVSGAYSSGEVSLSRPDTALGTRSYALSGLSDVRLRATGRIVGDNVVLTVGVNAPTGQTTLDAEEVSALRALAAPALALQTPAIGTGFGGTTGVVLARQVVGWAWALGLSYEMRGTYAPISAFVAGAPEPDFNPGDAVHVSLGSDGRIGQHGMTVALTADLYGKDRLSGSDLGDGGAAVVQLGPTLTVDWQLRLASHRFRELTLYAVDRYRSEFERAGTAIPGSSGNYLDLGVRSLLPLTRTLALRTGVDGRMHTGLTVDNTLATAATTTGGLTLGLVRDYGRYLLEPFARVQLGTIDVGGSSSSARGVSGGIVLGTRF